MTEREKDPDVPATYSIDWHDDLVPLAARDQDFAAGDVVRPQFGTGFYYECTEAGRTAAHWPARWPRAADETVQDGSVEWTARTPADVAEELPSIDTATWTVPSGIAKDSDSVEGWKTLITLSGGTDGEDYEITCRMTPTAGNAIERKITVPVRSQ